MLPCPSHQVRNPRTQRCVLKNGKIGKEVLAKMKRTSALHGSSVASNYNNGNGSEDSTSGEDEDKPSSIAMNPPPQNAELALEDKSALIAANPTLQNAEPAGGDSAFAPLSVSDALHEFISTGDASVFDRVKPWTHAVAEEVTNLLNVHRQNVPYLKEERPWWDLFSLGKKSYNMYEELFNNYLKRGVQTRPLGVGGVSRMAVVTSTKYDLKLLLINDVHFKGTCPLATNSPSTTTTTRSQPPPCSELMDFLTELIRDSYMTLDFFIEQDPSQRHATQPGSIDSSTISTTWLSEFFKQFLTMQTENGNYIYPYCRVHLTDARNSQMTNVENKCCNSIVSLMVAYQNYDPAVPRNDKAALNAANALLELPKIKALLENTFVRSVQQMCSPFIMKQLANVINANLRNTILKFWLNTNMLAEFKDGARLYDLLNIIQNKKVLSVDEANEVVSLCDQYLHAFTSVMGLYTTARLFRSYSPKQNTRKHSLQTRNGVLFAGGYHTNQYRRLFSELGFTTLFDKFAEFSSDGSQMKVDLSNVPVSTAFLSR